MWVSLMIMMKLLIMVMVVLMGVAFCSFNGSMQLSVGPQTVGVWGVLQPFANAVKLLAKESILPNHANQIIFLLAPIISLVLALEGWAVILCGTEAMLADMNMGMLYLFAVSSLGAYAVLCSGWANNSSYDLVSEFHTEYSAVLFFLFFLFYMCSLSSLISYWINWSVSIIYSTNIELLGQALYTDYAFYFLELAYANFSFYGTFAHSLGMLTASLTVFSSFRFIYLAFINTPNSSLSHFSHSHEPVLPMMFPLAFLTFCSIFVDYLFKDLFVGLGSPFFSSAILGRWLMFSSVIHSQFYLLAIFSMLSPVISVFYYLCLIKLMYFQDSPFFHSYVSKSLLHLVSLSLTSQ